VFCLQLVERISQLFEYCFFFIPLDLIVEYPLTPVAGGIAPVAIRTGEEWEQLLLAQFSFCLV
jgi:hypothetical protein